MNVDYSELGYFFIGNSYPYVDLTKLDATKVIFWLKNIILF